MATRTTSNGNCTIISPFSENITTMVNSSEISVMGLIFGMNFVSYHVLFFARMQAEARQHARDERDAQVDEDALGDFRPWRCPPRPP